MMFKCFIYIEKSESTTGDLEKQHGTFLWYSLVHHLMAIGEFKLELQSRNDQF